MSGAGQGPTPYVLATSFVKQYYGLLYSNPDILSRFYLEESVCTHGGPVHKPLEDIYVKGMEHIQKKIASHNFKSSRVDLTFVDCQPTLEGGVMILVHGHLNNNTSPPRRFTQSFLLARKGEGTFYVLNDILRVLDGPATAENEPAKTTGDAVESGALASAVISNEDPVANNGEADNTAGNDVVETDPEHPGHQEPNATSEETPSATHNTNKLAEETHTPIPTPSTVVKSWANIARLPGVAAPVSAPVSAPVQPVVVSPPVSAPAPAPVPVQPAQAAPATAIYVGNMDVFDETSGAPNSATVTALTEMFARFGPVLKVRPVLSKRFAFVEFSSNAAVTSAVKAAQTGNGLVLQSRRLHVEEKNVDQDRAAGGGRGARGAHRGGGRGGRGRGGF